MNKKILIPVAAITVLLGLGGLSASNVYAEEPERGFSSMIQRFTERFNLNADEVSTFMQEAQAARMEQRRVEVDSKLSQAVADGKITEDQKALIEAKMEENRANKEGWQELTREEKHEQTDSHREEMQAWAGENGIDLSSLELGREGMGMRGEGMKGRHF